MMRPLLATSLVALSTASFLPSTPEKQGLGKRDGLNVVSLTKHIPSSNSRRRFRRADGNVQFSNGPPLDGIYLGTIQLGTPGQSFTVQFDTGSADLWVYGSDANTTNHAKFDSSASSTFVGSTTSWGVTYGDGTSTVGFVAEDTLQIAGFSIPSQGFALANTTSVELNSEVEDGLLGLGFTALANDRETTFIENLIAGNGGTLNEPVFSLFLERDVTLENINSGTASDSSGGEICVGCIDSSHYTGSINYATVTSDVYWAVDCEGLTARGSLVEGTSMRILVDSGSSILNLPSSVIQTYAQSINADVQSQGGGNYILVVDCGTLNDLQLGFNVGGNVYDVAPLDIFAGTTSGGRCGFVLAATDATDVDNTPLAIVGDTFMKNWYTVFRYNSTTSHSIGFARAVQTHSGSLDGSGLPGTSSSSASGTSSGSSPSNTGSSSNQSSDGKRLRIGFGMVAGMIAAVVLL